MLAVIDTWFTGLRHRRRRRSLLVHDTGPGGPLLVVVDDVGFSRYLVEILRTEGVSSFRVVRVAELTSSLLADHDAVVLGPVGMDPLTVEELETWVDRGGNLVAIRPDPLLAGLLGLEPAAGSQRDGYISVDTSTAPGTGITSRPLQLHTEADHHRLAGAIAIASLWDRDRRSTGFPAVTLRQAGPAGGHAAAFTYDLGASIVHTRQGNPRWAGQNRDGDLVTRSNDLFFGAADGDPQRDWVDHDLLDVPQADEQQRLLVQLLQHVGAAGRPLPRFSYLPRDLRAAVVMTGDDHAFDGTAERFRDYASLDRPGDTPDDWTAVRATSYVYAHGSLSDADAALLEARGFEICPHVTTGANEWTTASLARAYRRQLAEFARTYPSVRPPISHRLHAVVWSDWASQAEVERANGIRLDTNYYYYPPPWVDGGTGFFTGSGLPMRFATATGEVVDCYQAVTLLTDESEQVFPAAIDDALDGALRPDGHVAVITVNMHTDLASSIGSDAIVRAARRRGVPVISARQLLTWLDARAAAAVTAIERTSTGLRFTVSAPPDARHLTVLIPVPPGCTGLRRATRDGEPLPVRHELIGGVVQASLPASTGAYDLEWSDERELPAATDVRVTVSSPREATIEWRSSTLTAGRVTVLADEGHESTSLDEGVARFRHVITARGLAPGRTHHVQVDGTTSSTPDLAFVTPHEPLVHRRAHDFLSGTCDGTIVSSGRDTSVILRPELWLEPATGAGPDWDASPGGSSDASEDGTGLLVLGTLVAARPVGPDRSFDVAAVLPSGQGGQLIGFVDGHGLGTCAAFRTDPADGQLTATIRVGGVCLDRRIPGRWDTSPHRFRIEWDRGLTTFAIDGRSVVSERVRLDGPLRPALGASDGAAGLHVLWARASHFGPTGTYTSAVIDHGSATRWGPIALTAPAVTLTGARTMIRTGDVPEPDDSWSDWILSTIDGGATTHQSRYLQYRIELLTASSRWTPEVTAITVERTP